MSSSNGAVQFARSMNNSSSSLHPDEAVAVPELDSAGNEGLRSPINKNTRLIFYLRIFIFFLIEASFIALAAACLAKPIVLNTFLSFSESEIKGGFTIVFVIWQSCATLAGGYILADAFSREWSVQLTRLRPGTTDRVSTVTSGFLDRTIHLFQRGASGTFKLAFFASLIFMALTQLAPGTISVSTILVNIPVQVQIGTLIDKVTDQNSDQFFAAESRASLIIRLEQIENAPSGLILQPNWLMATPAVDLTTLNGTLEYDSDVVSFHHDCHWEAPRVVNTSQSDGLILIGGQTWSAENPVVVGIEPNFLASSITPLFLTPLKAATQNTSTLAFLFIGGNDTFNAHSTSFPIFVIDLGALPSTFIPGGLGVMMTNLPVVGPLASVLVCDPHLQISGGRVRLTVDGTLSVIDSGRPVIGNFPPSAANLIFSNAFQNALLELDRPETVINSVASVMFMANSSADWSGAAKIPPLDIATINKKMDASMLSAGKAFINAYRKIGTPPTSSFNSTTTPAIVKEQRLALTTSKSLFQVVIAVFVLALALLCALCRSVLTKSRYLFDLHGVLSVLPWQEGNGFTKTTGCQSSLSLDGPLLSNTVVQ